MAHILTVTVVTEVLAIVGEYSPVFAARYQVAGQSLALRGVTYGLWGLRL